MRILIVQILFTEKTIFISSKLVLIHPHPCMEFILWIRSSNDRSGYQNSNLKFEIGKYLNLTLKSIKFFKLLFNVLKKGYIIKFCSWIDHKKNLF